MMWNLPYSLSINVIYILYHTDSSNHFEQRRFFISIIIRSSLVKNNKLHNLSTENIHFTLCHLQFLIHNCSIHDQKLCSQNTKIPHWGTQISLYWKERFSKINEFYRWSFSRYTTYINLKLFNMILSSCKLSQSNFCSGSLAL